MDRTELKHIVSEAEWQLRCDLASLYRLVAFHRMTDLIFTHISVKLPGEDHTFLINPYGLLFSEIKASDLLKIDVEGNIIDDGLKSPYRVNKAGFVIHSALHMARPDLICIVHTHTAAGVAVSTLKQGLMPISQHALKFHGHLAYHNYEGIALDMDERESLVADMGAHHRAMILRNHGLLVGGRTVPEAFDHIFFLERACDIQMRALAGGLENIVIPDMTVQDRTAAQYRMDEAAPPAFIDLAWDAALREAAILQSSAHS